MGTDVRLEISTTTRKQTTEDQIATHIQTKFIFCFTLQFYFCFTLQFYFLFYPPILFFVLPSNQ